MEFLVNSGIQFYKSIAIFWCIRNDLHCLPLRAGLLIKTIPAYTGLNFNYAVEINRDFFISRKSEGKKNRLELTEKHFSYKIQEKSNAKYVQNKAENLCITEEFLVKFC